ncbi:MAG: hypothetical protein AVDCRST_MAG71-1114 [uncultured Lysobacter sp.]|uniref:EF-hand domain-containing protein n=1 Tax=uncultured Lysobacter sp. TaxID=271060 RepID=A0A6J4KYI3_9GAMM|nr:MAG: hypothetical protein AVDCRST_MAG71-1114 [uncultured Lysobacter sp.]
MKRTASLLALAVAAALAAPVAIAQSASTSQSTGTSQATGTTQSRASGQSTGASQSTQQTGATQSTGSTGVMSQERTGDTTQSSRGVGAGQTMNESSPPPANEVEEEAMKPTRRTPPAQSQGTEQAAEHSAIAQRGVWTQLDTNGDGRISAAEGGVNADFKAGFEMMDADHDGFVSDAEYRAHGRTTHPENRGDATQQDPTTQGSTPTPAYEKSGTVRSDQKHSGQPIKSEKPKRTRGGKG